MTERPAGAPLTQTLRRHQLLTYFAVVFAATWLFWIPLSFVQGSVWFDTLQSLGNTMPSLAGIALTGLFTGKAGLRELFGRLRQVRVRPIWYASLLLFPGIKLAANAIPALAGQATLAFVLPTNLVGWFVFAGLAEELGWRGFALPRLQARHQALTASVLLGLVWGLWHLPLLIATGKGSAPDLLLFIGWITPAAVLYTWIYNNAKNSLFLIVLLHGMMDVGFLASKTSWLGVALSYGLLWTITAAVVLTTGPATLSRGRGSRTDPPGPGDLVPAAAAHRPPHRAGSPNPAPHATTATRQTIPTP